MKINMQQEIKRLKKWLEYNQPSKMSYLLGYKSSQTVLNWVERENIPDYQIERVKQIIEGDMKNEQRISSAG